MGDIIDSAINVNIIDKSGSWYSFKGTRLGQGKENVKAFLKENPKLADTIEGLLLDTLHGDDNLEEKENQKNDSPEKSVEQLFEIDEDGVVLD